MCQAAFWKKKNGSGSVREYEQRRISMDLRLLQYFLAVAEYENVTKAAEALHISQPSLSRQIAQMEADFGVQLLVRGNKSVKLTQEGILLKDRAAEMLALADKTKNELRNERQALAGTIYVGAVEIDSFCVLAKAMYSFSQVYPQVRFQVYSDNSKGIRENIDRGLIDFGFLLGTINLEKYNFYKVPVQERWGVLMQPDHSLAAKDAISEEDLLGQPVICPYRLMEDKTLPQWFPHFEDFQITATFNLTGNAATMVQQGLGMAICMDKQVFAGSHLKFVPLEPAHEETEGFLIWKKNHIIAKASEYFLREFCGGVYDE
jgi:DNA-binding transcriptional LysR family regulator